MKKWRKRFVKFLIFDLVIVLLLLSTGLIYQQVGAREDAKILVPPGKLYKVHGDNMHLYTGGEGDVTVVLASGWGTANPYVDYYPLYEKLAPNTKFAVYDRFGYGYSDRTDKKRDVDTVADELHELLEVSGQKPPYVLVGHSLGSLETLRFAQKYPDEVQGIVMIDGGSPEHYANDTSDTASVIGGFMNQFRIKTGLLRLSLQSDAVVEASNANRNELKLVPDNLKKLDTTALLHNYGNANTVDELREMSANAKVVVDNKKPFPFPLTILTADYFGASEPEWDKTQAEFTSWSEHSKHVTVKDTEHYIHQYHPDLVANEILELVKK
ncbi:MULTISPECIES: alpha/beta fold hydrolase [Paenibacillus]|uniref:Pimeloyl-ACP methyl ester carboxylesterase n=1 Tax=Paenibacillus pabuli TaxID=1472 RepID=A0A855XQD7_9BACL|nr:MULTISPECIES: alpha/beta hydrolase [Paenibacillus]PXW04096.1 pimeloyl-ACP methyl ester carboxylesterase [Paenibacillus taichungensis]SEN46884.1 Pimeloyl-ACP methyl ester carboxylesterase [Paenibacillus sp. OK076]PWW36797.1 pimeloyl-ACP methyl ester carboxylesterase [Paenibacillus pabuli]QLG40953.1 alpha/beta hydrolase [Paenibacillus sp. E222]RAJ00574.1 pimeloyl-ACP methyl ester carboxylesterase [Paenibacillus pabuli]